MSSTSASLWVNYIIAPLTSSVSRKLGLSWRGAKLKFVGHLAGLANPAVRHRINWVVLWTVCINAKYWPYPELHE